MKYISLIPLIALMLVSYLPAQEPAMRIKFKNGTGKEYLIENIKNIQFETVASSVEDLFDGEKLSIDDAFPNPFEDKIEINFRISVPGSPIATIFDAQGRVVNRFPDNSIEAGANKIFWDGTNEAGKLVAEGAYYCEIRFEGVVKVKKIVLKR